MIRFRTNFIATIFTYSCLALAFSACSDKLIDSLNPEIQATQPFSSNATSGIIICSTAECIQNAMQNALPGDIIRIEPGVYTGSTSTSGNSNARFYSVASGTSANPITIEASDASNKPVLQGSSISSKNVMHIKGGYWVIRNLDIRTGKKGMMLDNSDYTKILNCEVYDIGEEGIHLRDGTSNAEVTNCYVHDTGKLTNKFGEGIYIGSDKGKWSTYIKECDNNLISNNRIGPGVTAEHIDLKEGSSFNIIEHNIFDGAGINDQTNGGLSFMDVKGNNNITRFNCGFQNANGLLLNAFEIHVKVSGWGENNTFTNNHIKFSSNNSSSYIVSNPNSVNTTTAGCNVRVPSGNVSSSSVGSATCNSNTTPINCSLEGGGVSISSVSASNDDGNVPANTLDGDLVTRWSSNGSGQYITYDLGSVKSISSMKIAWYKGDQRNSYFKIRVGATTSSLSTVYNASTTGSSGTTLQLETYDFNQVSARYVRITGFGNSSNAWNSVTEVEIW
ncbi:MAG: right-handed parallel beta-helix repeat-containing protein [Cyclobacteriaceae bacterium]|nr:right-handed parallel beta-helix repeat-containing protein [Cyclobacteriaceae bacterium]